MMQLRALRVSLALGVFACAVAGYEWRPKPWRAEFRKWRWASQVNRTLDCFTQMNKFFFGKAYTLVNTKGIENCEVRLPANMAIQILEISAVRPTDYVAVDGGDELNIPFLSTKGIYKDEFERKYGPHYFPCYHNFLMFHASEPGANVTFHIWRPKGQMQ
ncbi:hypothetical protein AAVH_06289 [Aphelenchoides avenae]|nr:hypothetical protein AAVH_06289 [Aphelenchus avenae]